MDNHQLIPLNLAETLLLNLNLVKFLDQVDANYESGDRTTTQVVQRFFANRYGMTRSDTDGSMPFLRDCTSLGILTPAFAFGATLSDEYWTQIGFNIKEEFKIRYEDLDIPEFAPTPRAVLEVLAAACQNLVGSLCDSRFEATIFHANEAIVFKTPGYQLTFGTAGGLGAFIQKYIPAVTRAIRENCCR